MAKTKKIPIFKSADQYYDWLNAEEVARFDRHLAVKSGNRAALFDACVEALQDSDSVKVAIPRWALEPLLELLRTDIEKGAGGRSVRRHRSDLIDWNRFHTVVYRLIGSQYPDNRTKSQRRADRVRRFRESGYVDTSTPYPWDANNVPGDMTAFEAASRVLSTGPYAGAPKTIKRSFEKVREALARGEWWRYYPSRYVVYPKHHRDLLDREPRNFPTKPR